MAAAKRDFQRRFFEDNDDDEETEESEYVEQEEEEDVSDSTGSEPEFDTGPDRPMPANPISKANPPPTKRIYSDPGLHLERSDSSSPVVIETKEEDEEEKLRMMIIMQRKEAQKNKDTTGKRREALKRRERERDTEIAKAIAQAKKEHSQKTEGANSNRSSVQSSSVDGDLSHFSQTEKRPSYDSEKDLLMERERVAAEKLEHVRQALQKERERVEKEQLEKEEREKKEKEKEKQPEKDHGSHETNGNSEEARRAEILAQRQAKLAKRKSRDVAAAEKQALNQGLLKNSETEKEAKKEKVKHKEDKDKEKEKEKKREKKDEDDKDKKDDEHKEKKEKKVRKERKEGEEPSPIEKPEIGRRVSKKEKSEKRERSKRFKTLPGVLLLDEDLVSPSEPKSTTRSNPSSPKELVPPLGSKPQSPLNVESPRKAESQPPAPEENNDPQSPKTPKTPKTPGGLDTESFRDKIREHFLGASSRQGSFSKDKDKDANTDVSQNAVVMSAIDTQRFRKPMKSSDDPEESQKKKILSIISMFETSTKKSDLHALDHRKKTSSTSLDLEQRKKSNTSLDLDESHLAAEGAEPTPAQSKWDALRNNIVAKGNTDSELPPKAATWRKNPFEQPPTKVAPPVIKPAGGTFNDLVSVEITCVTPGVNIFYTTNGTFPNKFSPKYDPENPLVLTEDTNLRTIAIYKNNFLESRVVTAHFVVHS